MGVWTVVAHFTSVLFSTYYNFNTRDQHLTYVTVLAGPSTMKRLRILWFSLLVINLAKVSVNAVDSECDKQSSLNGYGLRNKLLCDYDILSRPSDVGATKVKLGLILKFIDFDDTTADILIVHSWMNLSWDDAHMDWRNDRQYSGIHSIHVSSDEIWKPDISVHNSGEIGFEQSGMPTTNCVVRNDKKITCIPAVKHVTRCTPNYQHWPFDRQNCTLRLGSWTYTKEEVDYEFLDNVLEMADYTENFQWKVLSMSVTRKLVPVSGLKDLHPSIFMNIILERHSIHSQATVIAPAILLIIMTLTVLWLNPMSVERMILAGLNLICHLLCIIDINWQVPFNGATLPSILIFHQNSMIIASVAFFLTTLLRQLKEIPFPAPVWLTSTTSSILANRAGQFFLLTTLDPKAFATLGTVEDDNAGLVQVHSSAPKIDPGTSAWDHFATLVDRLSFYAILFTYAIMLLILIPKNDIKDS